MLVGTRKQDPAFQNRHHSCSGILGWSSISPESGATIFCLGEGVIAGGGAALLYEPKALDGLTPSNNDQKVGIEALSLAPTGALSKLTGSKAGWHRHRPQGAAGAGAADRRELRE